MITREEATSAATRSGLCTLPSVCHLEVLEKEADASAGDPMTSPENGRSEKDNLLEGP